MDHCNIASTEITDELARLGSEMKKSNLKSDYFFGQLGNGF